MVKPPMLLTSATEIAYHLKCVELRRQLDEIEELNKTFHLRESTLSEEHLSKVTPALLLHDIPGAQCSSLSANPDKHEHSITEKQPESTLQVKASCDAPTASSKKRHRRRRAKVSKLTSAAETPIAGNDIVEHSTTPKVNAEGPLTFHAIAAKDPEADARLQRETQRMLLCKIYIFMEAGNEMDWDRIAELMGNRRTTLEIEQHVMWIAKSFQKRGDWVPGKLDRWRSVREKGAARRRERDALEVRGEE